MELSKINELLSDLENVQSSKLKYVKREKGYQGVSGNSYGNSGAGVQGEYDEYSDIYKVVDEGDLYMKVTKKTDSYGSGDAVTSVQFVKEAKKEVTVFESIK